MCLKSHWISETKKIILIKEQTNGTFWGQVDFLFLFFHDCRTLKFLKRKCN